jgi:hypothetical protein
MGFVLAHEIQQFRSAMRCAETTVLSSLNDEEETNWVFLAAVRLKYRPIS